MSVDAAAYAVVKVDEIHGELRRSRSYRALEQGVTVIGFGVLCYGFCMLYEVLSDMGNKVEEIIGNVVEGIPVPESVFTDEGFTILEAHYEAKGWLAHWSFLRLYEDLRSKYQGNKALPYTARVQAKVAEWTAIIRKVKPEAITEEKIPKIHPVDRVVGAILNNRRTYFGLVGGLALLPAVPAVGSILRSSLRHEAS